VAHQREALVRAAIDIRDHLTSAALADRLGQALWAAGVGEVRADGEPFDPQRHQAVDHVATAERSLDGTVAATERPGYVDGGAVVRPPQVVVHRYQP
jgi:molecular chaperone GrpE (heat shock protein)